jgi:ribosomal protein S18 acetylase RimI-like enzyme
VRPALRGDLVPLTFFFDTLLRDDYFLRRGQLREILEGPHHELLVAELDSILVGAAITTRGSQLVNVLVHPTYRGLGVGRALVRRSGAASVRVKRDMSTGDPRGFYESLGFETTGDRNAKGNIELMRLRPERSNGSGIDRARRNGRAGQDKSGVRRQACGSSGK